MSWDSVEVGLAGGEETVTFGPRNETGSALYQVDTLACVSPRGKVEELPTIFSTSSQDAFCAVISKQVLLFNSSCTVLQATLNFDDDVDKAALNEDSTFMAIGERSGKFHFLHIASQQILFSQELVSSTEANGNGTTFLDIFFTPPKSDGLQGLVILTSIGFLFEFSCLRLQELHQAIDNQDLSHVKDLKESIVTKCSNVNEAHQEVLAGLTTASHMGAPVFITYGKESNMAVWGSDPVEKVDSNTVLLNTIESFILGSGVQKACTSCDGSFVVVLDEQNMLSLWDVDSLTMTAFWHHLAVEDFLLVSASGVQTSTSSCEEELKIILLTKPTEIKTKRFLQVYTLPSMKQMYSIQVSDTCYIARSLSSQETIYFIEAVTERSNYEEDNVALRIRCLTEALPENRFYRLLHKHQFDAAEAFARQFGLDVELVFKVKANTLLDKVSIWSNKDQEVFNVNDLKDCFAKIKDDEYVANCCLQAVLPTMEDTYDILRYARERVSKKDMTNGVSYSPTKKLQEILPVLDKLATFEMAYSIQNFSGTRWHSFRNADLLAEVWPCLEHGEICSAVTIWRRHQSLFEKDFSTDKLGFLLGSIRQDLKSSLIVPWLRDDLVPFVIRVLPQGIETLASWLEQRARTMELTEKSGWPANALELASVLQAPSNCSSTQDENNEQNQQSGLARLAELVRHLRELLDLHTKYSCRISLAEFSKETTSTLVFRFLDSIKAAELLPQAMNKYIAPYMIHHSLDKDQVLLDYVKEMFHKISGSYSSLSNPLWEARVIAVITYIKDKHAYCQATQEVMRHALVPWSDAVEKLVHDAMTVYPNNLELKEQYRFVELKKVLRLYGMKSTQVPDAAKAKSIVRVILTRDEPTAMEDALKVVQAYSHLSESDVYVFRLQKLCLGERVSECVELLHSLPRNKAAQYAEEIITWLCGILQERMFVELDCTKEHIVAAQNAVSILKLIKKRELHTYHDVDELLADLTNISSLQREFSEFLSLDDYRDVMKREELFQRYLGLYLQGQNTTKDEKPDKPVSLTRLTRLCNLIVITEENLMTRLADQALLSGDTRTALQICRDLLEFAARSSTSHALYTIAHALCKRMAEGLVLSLDANENRKRTNLTKEIHHLLCSILNLCKPDLLCDCLELCKCIGLANEVYAQCETGDYGFSVQSMTKSSKKDLLSEWTFDKRFKEDGLVLDSVIALPLAGKFSVACVPDGRNTNKLYYQARVAGRNISDQEKCKNNENQSNPMPSRLIQVSSAGLNVIRHLQENNLYKLALRYECETIGVCLQHYAANSLTVDKESDNASMLKSEKQHLAQISVMGLNISAELIGGLLVKVFNHKTVDHDLGLGYVCSIPKQLALEKMKSRAFFPAQNYGKIMALAHVGIDFAVLNNEPLVLENYQKISSNATWGHKLSKMKIYIKDVYKLNVEEMVRLLPDLIENKDVDLEMLLHFCKTFNVDDEEALLTYIKMQLLPPVTMDTDGEPDDTDTPAYERNVRAAVPKISSDSLLQLLLHVCSKVDPYDYNKILFILKLTKEHASSDVIPTVDKGIQLLEYLNHYERKSLPSKYEKTFSYSMTTEDKEKMSMSTERPLAPLSKSRLPFHPLLHGEPWKVIAAELSEDTVPKLIGVAKLLKLSTDQMYLTAIQNLFKSTQKRSSGSSEPSLDESTTDIDSADSLKRFDFERARGLLYSVKNKEMAIAAAKWMAQQLPLGEEKINVLETCVDLADDWQNTCTPEEAKKANVTYSRLKELSRGIATEYVLHKYDIAEPSLVAMVNQPAKLICQLYDTHGARDIDVRDQPPDINKASDEIASINNSKISKIRLYLIEKWLPSSPATSEVSLNESTDQALTDYIENTEDSMNLKRVVYVLQSSPVEHNVMFLLNFAYKEMSSANITSLCRLRSLRALFAIAPDDVIVKVSKKPIDSIRQYMTSLTYLAELEALHIQQSLSAFQKCNKEGLVRGLWRNHNHEKRAVRLVADLCLVNKIHDPQLWNSVLQQLLSFGMIKYLRHVLVSIAAVPELWQVPCLPNVWRSVLLAPFKSVCLPLSDVELESCTESATLLQRCPLLLDLDLEVIAEHFCRVGLHAYALACIILIPSNKTRRAKIKCFMQDLLQTNSAVVILDQLQHQREHAQTLSNVKMIEQEVFQYIENNQEYEVLLGTVHFDKMVRVLISTDQIDGLLLKTLKANRLEDAVKLVGSYHQAYPDSASGRYASQSDQLNGFEELWAFLEVRHKLEEALPFLPQPEEDDEATEEFDESKMDSIINEKNSLLEIYEHE